MTTKTILGLAAASLFTIASAASAQDVKSKNPTISTQEGGIVAALGGTTGTSLATTIVAIAGTAGAVGAIASGGNSGGGTSTTSSTLLRGNR
ncbi:MAG: hypothetical protein ABGX15_06740 [Paracoccaceae bacterium]